MSSFRDQVKIAERVYNYYDSQNRILKNQKNYINKKNEFLKFCTICKKVWENCNRVGGDSKSKNKINWYDDFPSYGKPRETCERCK